jgi:hypothetical protein
MERATTTVAIQSVAGRQAAVGLAGVGIGG